MPALLFATPNDDLTNAASNNDLAGVKSALKTGANVNAKDQSGWTALDHSIQKKNAQLVKLLIQAKAQVNPLNELIGGRPLLRATSLGQTEIVRLLIKSGANVNDVSEKGSTALMNAAFYGHNDIVRMLITAKADVNLSGESGFAPLDLALQMHHAEAAKLLQVAGAKTSPRASVPAPVATTTVSKKPSQSEWARFIDGCISGRLQGFETTKRTCAAFADCVVQSIYDDPKGRCDTKAPGSSYCISIQEKISQRAITACGVQSHNQAGAKPDAGAGDLARWAWTQKSTTGTDSSSNSAATPKEKYDPTKPREKTENEKWRDCRATGQSGCGYR